MAMVVAAIVIVGGLCVLNLLLLLGVIKRLRELTETVNGGQGALAVGQAISGFDTSTVTGEPLTDVRLDQETLVGFFSPTCAPCQEKLPAFIQRAWDWQGGRSRVLAVIVGEPAAEMVSRLDPVAMVAKEERDGPIGSAFGVKAYPTVCTVARDAEGRLAVARTDILDLEPVTAAPA